MMPVTAMFALRVDRRTSGNSELQLLGITRRGIWLGYAQGLQREGLTSGALVYPRLLAHRQLALGLADVHTHKYPDVKVR